MKNQEIINYESYPIDLPDHPVRMAVIERVQAELAEDGCALLKNFLSPGGLEALLGEAAERRPLAYFSEQKQTSAYLNNPDPAHAEERAPWISAKSKN